MKLNTTELSLLVIAGLTAAGYSKSEGANSLLAAVIGVAVPVVIYLVTR